MTNSASLKRAGGSDFPFKTGRQTGRCGLSFAGRPHRQKLFQRKRRPKRSCIALSAGSKFNQRHNVCKMLQGNRRISGRDCAKRPFALRQAALCHKKATRSLGRDSKDEQHKNSHYRVMDCVALFNRFQLFGYEKQGSGA